jgi:hypothetical protein
MSKTVFLAVFGGAGESCLHHFTAAIAPRCVICIALRIQTSLLTLVACSH